MRRPPRARWLAVPAAVALPAGASLLLAVAALSAAVGGRLGPGFPLACVAVAEALVGALAGPAVVAPLAVIGWMTAVSVEHRPYGYLAPAGSQPWRAALLVMAAAATGYAVRATLGRVSRLGRLAGAVDTRRRVVGVLLALGLLPLLTVALTALRGRLSLADELLIYLIAVVAVTVVGGLWPAVAAAVGASLLLNWFFTEPFHTLTIAEPDNLLALLLFIVVAVSVAAVVHQAARRATQAERSQAESATLLRLARTVLAGDDSVAAVLRLLEEATGVPAELRERVGTGWSHIAGARGEGGPLRPVPVRADLLLVLHGDPPAGAERLLEAVAGQAAAALDRERLRTQAAQAEALAAGNRMRTALLAAVSHDLRTPLASIKASISSLRQDDVAWSAQDEAELLATIEESTDRLHELIANLLDMSRVQTGALQPYLRPTAVDEVVPLALRHVPGAQAVGLDVAEDLPLVLTDAGLLERALANLLSNALRYSPPDRPPSVLAGCDGGRVELRVVDHGPGVPAADRERIFEPFQRLGDQPAGTGVGLGLAVARGFVEALGGELAVDDTPGGGLTMRVALPVDARVPVRR